MLTDEYIQELIARTVQEELGPSSLGASIRKDLNDRGEKLLRVTVVIDPDGEPDPQRMLGLVRRIRSRLSDDADQLGFPLLSFMTREDASKLGLELA